jgi:hypothetical protein
VKDIIDQGGSCDIIFFDYWKAFDMVSHSKLVTKIQEIGIQGNINSWIKEWLNLREQRVVLNGSKSGWTQVLSGVPQGSVLGPILFLIYVNDIWKNVPGFLSLFADGTKCIGEVDLERLSDVIQPSINALQDWAQEWSMEFNESKCSVLHLGKNNPRQQYSLNGCSIKTSSEEKDVGVIIQDDLKHDKHCQKVALTCNRIMGQIWRGFKHKDLQLMMNLYKTYILPHIDYGVVVWAPYLKKDIQTIESIQRKFTRMIKGMKGLSYEERLVKLELPTLLNRRRKVDLIQAYKIKNKIDHVDASLFQTVKSTNQKNTRSSVKEDFVVKKCRTEMRRNFFSNRVVEDWNRLPVEVQNAKTLTAFKKKLETNLNILR